MKETLLTTKYQLPPKQMQLVSRPRLMAKLSRTPSRKLILITAPVGFGKTTLVREWIEHTGLRAAWLALDDHDNNSRRFTLYLVHALRQIGRDVGEESLTLLNSVHAPRPAAVLTPLINELAALDHCILVLDDYHVIEEGAIHEAVDFFIAHLPSNIQLVMTSRSQPPLSLARLRSQAQLLELDSADLRFTAVEVEQFLTKVMHLSLSPVERTALEMRTEGWIAGLQLAGLSLQGETNPSGYIDTFRGTDRHVGDYLFEEVLRHQPDQVRQFLLHTSIVDSLCAELCDALLDQNNSQAMLEQLDRLRLFVIPLDNQRQWYRYHALFRDLLQHHLNIEYPERIIRLHARASLWYEQQGRLNEAIHHGLLAEDYDRTAGLIEAVFQHRDWVHHDMHHLLSWFESLPAEATHSRPKLILAYAWLLLETFSDRWSQIENRLRQVEEILMSPTANAAHSKEGIALMLAQVDLLRANHARHDGQPDRVIALCQQALARLPKDERYIRSGTLAHLASAYETTGRTQESSRLFAESIQMCRAAENVDGLLFAYAHLIEVHKLSGQLQQAEKVFAQAEKYADRRTGPDMGMIYIRISEIYHEQNRLELAKDLLKKGVDLCQPFAAWNHAVIAGLIGTARILAVEDRFDDALNVLRDIEREHLEVTPFETARLESVRARLELQQGHYQAASRWAIRLGSANIDTPAYDDEFDLLTYIRVLLAQAALESQGIQVVQISSAPAQEAQEWLGNLYHDAQSSGRLGRVVEICALQALASALQHDTTTGLKRLEAVLELAEPEGYVRLFVDEGLPMYRLLMTLRTRPIASIIPRDYLNALLDAFPRSLRQSTGDILPGSSLLTESEQTTLRLLATERSIEEIAAELSVAVSTIRTYTKRIYSKLDAHSRAEAVYRAKALKLV